MAADKNILTGHYVRIEQIPAKMSLRVFGFLIDMVVTVAYFFGTLFLMRFMGLPLRDEVFFLFVLLPMLVYQPACETLTGGQTLGKFLLRTRVVRVDGSSPSVGDFLLRWLLLPIDLLFFGAVAAFGMLVTPRRQRLGDLTAGTMVISTNIHNKLRISLDDYDLGNP